eukprot:8580191-Alexandrium_andersonii.AAC.1
MSHIGAQRPMSEQRDDARGGQPSSPGGISSAGVPRPESEEAWWLELESDMQDEARRNLMKRTP